MCASWFVSSTALRARSHRKCTRLKCFLCGRLQPQTQGQRYLLVGSCVSHVCERTFVPYVVYALPAMACMSFDYWCLCSQCAVWVCVRVCVRAQVLVNIAYYARMLRSHGSVILCVVYGNLLSNFALHVCVEVNERFGTKPIHLKCEMRSRICPELIHSAPRVGEIHANCVSANNNQHPAMRYVVIEMQIKLTPGVTSSAEARRLRLWDTQHTAQSATRYDE